MLVGEYGALLDINSGIYTVGVIAEHHTPLFRLCEEIGASSQSVFEANSQEAHTQV